MFIKGSVKAGAFAQMTIRSTANRSNANRASANRSSANYHFFHTREYVNLIFIKYMKVLLYIVWRLYIVGQSGFFGGSLRGKKLPRGFAWDPGEEGGNPRVVTRFQRFCQKINEYYHFEHDFMIF